MKRQEFILEEKVCLTPEAQYHFSLDEKEIVVRVTFPASLDLSKKEAKDIENASHTAMESVLAPYWHQIKS
jgi:predicted PP-loop superfamily ATPase